MDNGFCLFVGEFHHSTIYNGIFSFDIPECHYLDSIITEIHLLLALTLYLEAGKPHHHSNTYLKPTYCAKCTMLRRNLVIH